MHIDHLVVLASDLQASLPFYDTLFELIGFEKIRPHVYVDANGVGFDLRQAGDASGTYGRYAPGLNHIGVAAASVEEVKGIAAGMRAAGFDTPEIQRIDTAHCLFMKDPEGMRVEIAYDPPATG